MKLARTLALVVVATLLLLEVVLQIAAYVVSTSHARPDAAPAISGDVVLCVGDSYTYGIGAASPDTNYPGQLQARLRAQGRDVTVLNAGWPGQNSEDIFDKLGPQLAVQHPCVVCILVGLNDRFRHPRRVAFDPQTAVAAVTTAPAPSGFEWRWRTGRLFEWAFGNPGTQLTTGAAAPSEPPSAPVDAPPPPEPRLVGGDVDAAPAWNMFTAGQLEAAAVFSKAALALEPASAHVFLDILARSYSMMGDKPEARRWIDRLRARHDRDPDPVCADSLVYALQAYGDEAMLLEFADVCTRLHPELPTGWWLVANIHAVGGNTARVEAAAARFEAVAPAGHPLRPWLYYALARAWRTDVAKVVEYTLRGLLLDANRTQAMEILRSHGGSITRELLVATADRLAPPPDGRVLVDGLIEAMFEDQKAKAMADYEHNLGAICQRVRAAGALPIIITYPHDLPEVEPAQVRAAHAAGVPLVSVRPWFAERSAGMTAAEFLSAFFVADLHCNDAGYAAMAEMIAPVVAAALAAK